MKTIQYKDRYWISYTEFGDANGFPIFTQHGMVASVTESHLFDRLIKARLRVICMARPGYGESSPYRMKNIAEWGDIAAVLVKTLGIQQFDVLGMSSGAPYSYAIGFKLPEQVRNIFIFSGIPALYNDRVLALWPHPNNKQAELSELQQLARELFFPNVTQKDPGNDAIRDSMMNDCFGPALDLKLRCQDWGFDLSQVSAPVFMQHSKADLLDAAKLTAELLPNCHLEIRESEEHFSAELLDDYIKNTILKQFQAE